MILNSTFSVNTASTYSAGRSLAIAEPLHIVAGSSPTLAGFHDIDEVSHLVPQLPYTVVKNFL